ncbi:glycosyltransferase family 4 protein [Flavobacterium phragmitis]|uniref:Glycosyl transferases group 1 n=1 Tax=Flavobacterium phragmitis TaxID=739143 RepID=A0A1I1K0D2_9FLAO|nr:glycosyltransferase [Flavobacterium phragmitis]SFC52208.1 Glycosyl transferases group 1 [Flavobacterium phragmitis]
MAIFKSIKRYYTQKEEVKKQSDQSIPNYNTYNPHNKTIVFLTLHMPAPAHDSGSNRLKEIILFFKNKNYNCIICSKNTFRDNGYVDYFSDLGAIVFVESSQYSSYFDFLKSLPKVDFVWYYGGKSFYSNLKKVSKILPEAISLYDMIDIHFLRYKRAIKINPKRISLWKNFLKFFFIETKLARKVDLVATISNVEKEIMSRYIDDDKLITIPNIHYPKISKEKSLLFEDREGILFIGSKHEPNIDAVHYLYHEIMPIVWKENNEIKVNIIGNLNENIQGIEDSRFIFTGHVCDIEPFFTANKFMIAPLRYGAGVKGKIGQAFEYYLPVITSSIGAEGMELIHQRNALIYDAKEEFALAILNLYNNQPLWQELHQNSEQSLKPFSNKALEELFLKFDTL